MGGPVHRYVTNPVQRLWAGLFTGIRHPGTRRPQVRQAYRTPLNVFPTTDGVAVLLTYGPNRDWLKNITAAGNAELRHMGKTIRLTEPRVMSTAEAATQVTEFWRPIFPRLPFESAVLLTRR
jgi:deazaflavin-dependent oxidoreductase (nitroreductase family)